MSDLFCRHNRFTADCSICSKGTVLEAAAPGTRARPAKPAGKKKGRAAAGGGAFRGPYASAGPYERDGDRVEVRLERVPGGVRLAEWAGGALRSHAPVLPAGDLRGLVAEARERALLPERDLARLEAAVGAGSGPAAGGTPGPARASDPEPVPGESPQPAGGSERGAGDGERWGASRGRTADLQDELRVEAVEDGQVRVARWILRPGAGWELQDAPPMLPAARFAEALAAAARAGAA